MEYSTVLDYAQQLKNLLTSHDQAVTQLNLLEGKIQQLDHYLFTADINGSHGYRKHLMIQKSTTLGIRKMYNQYREKKWNQIQELSTVIMKSANSTPSSPDSTPESSRRHTQSDNDPTVQSMTEDFCVFSRDC
ncbi:uncharacterized protein LOC143045536 [Mytilus galloprovincialis]|uniref:uncharacterized protein LOC143045536 n=1 Tax=Mytilus galloprovincialis TaxID=29158 RepID=UPI003F7C332F